MISKHGVKRDEEMMENRAESRIESRIENRVEDILSWKGEKPEIKKTLDNLNVGEEYYDPNTHTRYECISKMRNGESITISRSPNVDII